MEENNNLNCKSEKKEKREKKERIKPHINLTIIVKSVKK